MAALDDSVVAWGLLMLVLAAYGLAPDALRARWWAALTRRSDQ
jgi:hypothetical protein